MDLVIAAANAKNHHLQEIGIVISAVGALGVVLSGLFGVRSMSRLVERSTMMVGGLLLGVGFIVQLLALHGTGK
jgi:hypothetical protein